MPQTSETSAVNELVLVVSHTPDAALGHAIAELSAFCTETGRVRCRCAASPGAPETLNVLVGQQAIRRFAGERLAAEVECVAAQGFILKDVAPASARMLAAAGRDDTGTRNAVNRLACLLDVSRTPATMPARLDLCESPAFSLRGMYAHQHWDYNYPYALRTWSVAEWQQYLDILGLMGCNLFQIWSMAGILPVPFSPDDMAFLERYPPVMDYARQKHTMEAWIGECANNVCDRSDVPPIAERDYFDYETLKDPGDPAQMSDLQEARRAFYRACPNADGYWAIDSDPGGWPDSPPSAYVDILKMNRELIDSETERGRAAKLVYWMHFGWGTDTQERNWRQALLGMKDRVREPWLLSGGKCHFGVVGELGMWDHFLYYQYGAVEPEPSLPFTRVVPPALTDLLDTGGLGKACVGAMGNAQTPLCQLPNIYHLLRSLWTGRHDMDPEETMGELAALVYPERAGLLKKSWLALRGLDPEELDSLASEMAEALHTRSLGVPGAVGRKVFPDSGQIARDMVRQLRTHASGARFCRAAQDPEADRAKLADGLLEYCRLSLGWRRHTGFRRYAFNGYSFDPVDAAAKKLWWHGDGMKESIVSGLREALLAEFEPWEVELALLPLSHPPPQTARH